MIRTARLTVGVALLTATTLLPAFAAEHVSLYQRQETLGATLRATRAAFVEWQQRQSTTRSEVQWGPWQTTAPLAFGAPAPPSELPQQNADQPPIWTTIGPQQNGQQMLIPPEQSHPAATVYRRCEVTATQPVALTIGIAGGDRIEVWLNEHKLADLDTRTTYQRYGCSMTADQVFADRYLIDLPIPAGTSRLLIGVRQQTIHRRSAFRFWFSTSPNPVPRFWQRIRDDFPPRNNALLATVSPAWFESGGWFNARDAHFERDLLAVVSKENLLLASVLDPRITALQAAAPPDDDPRWLNLCIDAADANRAISDLERLAASVAELGRAFPARYPTARFSAQIQSLHSDAFAAAGATHSVNRKLPALLEEIGKLRWEALVAANPLLAGRKLIFAKRYTYDSKHYYDDYYAGLREWGGNLCELNLADNRVREIVPQLQGGIFDRYDISHDGQRLVFDYRAPKPEGFRIWEVRVDGSGLRQLTFPPGDEDERMARHNAYSKVALQNDPRLYGHWTDDMHPCYLPDGRIVFVSSRSERTVLCGGHSLTCTSLHRIDADGKNMHQLSQGALTESTPTMLEDGRILYTRWEYVYKGIAAVQSLWAMRPDGTATEEIYGHNIDNPGVFFAGRQVPGRPDQIVATGCGHEPLAVGSIVAVDRNKDRRTKEAMISLTPEVETRGLRGFYHLRNGQWYKDDINGPFYCDPYPLSDPATAAGAGSYFLVSHNPDRRYNDRSAYGIYLIDKFGNRVLVHDDPEMSCFQPMVLAPRPRLQASLSLAAASNDPPHDDQAGKQNEAVVVLADVYENLEGVSPGTVKYLRVMEQIPRSWNASQINSHDSVPGQAPAISLHTHIWVAVLLGVVPVEPDGSACFRVPADRNIFFEALDENFMEVQKMRTFVNFQPGEVRSCVGCHDRRDSPHVLNSPLAIRKQPARIRPQPGDDGPRPIHYAADVQPIFDRHCVSCHGAEDPDGGLDLSGVLTTHFNRSYEELLKKGWVPFIQEWTGPAAQDRGPYHISNGSMSFSEAVGPYTFGSHRSKLIALLRKGHEDARLSQDEFVRLVTWIDANAPYYGSYYGRRHISARGRPDFRPIPTLESARGVEPPRYTTPPIPANLLARFGRSAGERLPTQFDGATFVAGGSLGEQDAVSLAMWIRPKELLNRWSPLLFTDGRDDCSLHVSLLEDGTPNVAVNAGNEHWIHQRANGPLELGRWQHVAVICDPRFGGSVRFYIDGTLQGKGPLDIGRPLNLAAFRIGAWNHWEKQPRNNFHGELEDFRIYHGSLDEEQVAALAAAENRPRED